MLGMNFNAKVGILSVSQWNIEKENKAGFTVWMILSESTTQNKKGFEPVKASFDISRAGDLAPILSSEVKLPVVCDCTFTLTTGGQQAKPSLVSIDEVIHEIEL